MNNLDQRFTEEDDSEDEWDRTRRVAVVQLICHIVHILSLCHSSMYGSCKQKNLVAQYKEQARGEIMHHLQTHSKDCHDLIRMTPDTFLLLCIKLRNTGLLNDSVRCSLQEKVVTFLMIVSHNLKLRVVVVFFCRSIETICKQFHSVLRSMMSLEAEYLKQPDGSQVPSEIANTSRFFPYFKDCVGALDGTHIRVKVSNADAPRFRGRKDYPTPNVLIACTFDLRFTYILAGWEGSTSDSRIIKNALTRGDNLKFPSGKYYLVDAGFILRSGLIAPYRGVLYHLKEYLARGPENAKELFNLRHASLHNAVERAFGVLKKRFPIIGSSNEKTYSFVVQCEIVLACFILHNFLMSLGALEEEISEVDMELSNRGDTESQVDSRERDNEDARLGAQIRDNIVAQMWNDYASNH